MTGRNLSKVARVAGDKQCIIEDYVSHLHGGLGNLYVSDSPPGDVIHVEVSNRTDNDASLTRVIRAAISTLRDDSEGKEIAMGDVFNVLQGQVRAHVSPDIDCIPFPSLPLLRPEQGGGRSPGFPAVREDEHKRTIVKASRTRWASFAKSPHPTLDGTGASGQ